MTFYSDDDGYIYWTHPREWDSTDTKMIDWHEPFNPDFEIIKIIFDLDSTPMIWTEELYVK